LNDSSDVQHERRHRQHQQHDRAEQGEREEQVGALEQAGDQAV
jgi:hypothetical protein